MVNDGCKRNIFYSYSEMVRFETWFHGRNLFCLGNSVLVEVSFITHDNILRHMTSYTRRLGSATLNFAFSSHKVGKLIDGRLIPNYKGVQCTNTTMLLKTSDKRKNSV